MTYEAFRQFADSWGLLFMVLSWLALAFWAFRPGSGERSRKAAHSIFEDTPDESQADER